MKECLILLHPGAEWYGADKILVNSVVALSVDYRCIVVLPEDGPLVKHLREAGATVVVQAFPVIRRSIFTPSGIIRFAVEYVRSIVDLRRLARDNRCTTVYCNTFAVLQGVAFFLLGYKHIWHIHEIILKPKAMGFALMILARQFSTRVIAVSNAVADRLRGKHVVRLYNGIEPVGTPRTARNDGTTTLGVIGRFNSWKGQLDAVRSFQEVQRKLGGHRLLLCGGVFRDERSHLEALLRHIQENGLSDSVEILPFTEDVASVYAKIDIFLLPSTSPDPFPTVVLEAMSQGIPILGYRHGGIVEMLEGRAEFLAAPGDFVDLAGKITALSQDPVRFQATRDYLLTRFRDNYSLARYSRDLRDLLKGT